MQRGGTLLARFTWAALALAALTSTGCSGTAEPYENTDISEQEVIYGSDDRSEVGAHPDMLKRELAESVAILSRSAVTIDPTTGNATLTESTLNQMLGGNACADEPYRDQAIAGHCTGWLISPTRMVTAGHCFYKDFSNPHGNAATLAAQCSQITATFDFELNPGNTRDDIDSGDVLRCKQVLDYYYDGSGVDYAVFELDRDSGRPGLPVEESPSMSNGDDVYMIGHPSGLLKKIADGAEVTNATPSWGFESNLDAYHSNSGSPVFDETTDNVVGILVRGEGDWDSSSGCTRSRVLANSAGSEDVVTIDQIGQWTDVGEPNANMAAVSERPVLLNPTQQGTATYSSLGVRQGVNNREHRQISGSWDNDFIGIAVYPGDQITVSIDFAHASGDLDLKLLDGGGNEMDSSTGIVDGETVSGTAGGLYGQIWYAKVYGYNGAANDYALTIDVVPLKLDLDSDGTVDARTTCGGPAAVSCPDIPTGPYTFIAQECNPRPNRTHALDAGEELDLAEAAGVCEPNNWMHHIYLPFATDHPYANNEDVTYLVGLPMAASSAQLNGVTFQTETGWDKLRLTNGQLKSGTITNPTFSDTPANKVVDDRLTRPSLELRFTSDGTVTDYGFWFYSFHWGS